MMVCFSSEKVTTVKNASLQIDQFYPWVPFMRITNVASIYVFQLATFGGVPSIRNDTIRNVFEFVIFSLRV
jgi:hypothetical protein